MKSLRPVPYLIVLLALAPIVGGQEQWIELLRSDLRADKAAILTASLDLDAAEYDKFWPLYREYELELAKLGDRRLALLKRYAASHESMSNEEAKKLANAWFHLQEDHTKLKKKYFGRVEKVLSATLAARFLQVEHQIQLLTELGMASEIPLVKPVRK